MIIARPITSLVVANDIPVLLFLLCLLAGTLYKEKLTSISYSFGYPEDWFVKEEYKFLTFSPSSVSKVVFWNFPSFL